MSQQQPELWIGLVEVRPLDRTAYGADGAFTYIVTRARDAAEFRRKADATIVALDLYVTGVDAEEPVVQWMAKRAPSDEIKDVIERAQLNPNAVVWGNFEQYGVDQA